MSDVKTEGATDSMSNSRKLKRPKHVCGDRHQAIHMHCDHCGYTDDITICEGGVEGFLYEMGVWTHHGDCPACKGDGAFHVRPGRDWLGEPNVVFECDNDCAPPILREALLEVGIGADCLGDYGTDGGRTALYRMFDAKDRLLYIGISNDFGRRWKQHAEGKPWYPEVRRQTVEWHDSRTRALGAEAAAIKAEKPLYNVTHARQKDPTPADWAHLDWPSRLRLRADLIEKGQLIPPQEVS